MSHDDDETASKEAKLWGGRFEESVTEKVEKFTESISFDKHLYKQDIKGSKAHATMLAHQVLLFTCCILLTSSIKFDSFLYCYRGLLLVAIKIAF